MIYFNFLSTFNCFEIYILLNFIIDLFNYYIICTIIDLSIKITFCIFYNINKYNINIKTMIYLLINYI